MVLSFAFRCSETTQVVMTRRHDPTAWFVPDIQILHELLRDLHDVLSGETSNYIQYDDIQQKLYHKVRE